MAAAAYIISGLVLLFFLRPDPFVVTRAIAVGERKAIESSAETKPEPFSTDRRRFAVDALAMVLTQLVMVVIMTMTPVFMGHYGHGLSAVGTIIGDSI